MRKYGEKYDEGLSIKEIAKLVKKDLVEEFPNYKFSVRKKAFAHGQSLNILVTMQGDVTDGPKFAYMHDFKRELKRAIKNAVYSIADEYNYHGWDYGDEGSNFYVNVNVRSEQDE